MFLYLIYLLYCSVFNTLIQNLDLCIKKIFRTNFGNFIKLFFLGEEALNPERNIPLSIALSLAFVFVAYFCMSSVLTLAIPYCMEVCGNYLFHINELSGH